MKKTLIALAIAFTCFAAQSFAQKLTLKNTTTCSNVEFIVYAHDCSTCSPYNTTCSLVSNVISLAPGTSVTFANVTNLNLSPGWTGSVLAAGGAGSGWDGVTFNTPGATCTATALGISSCITTNTSALLLSCPCIDWHGVWQTIGSNYVVNITDWN